MSIAEKLEDAGELGEESVALLRLLTLLRDAALVSNLERAERRLEAILGAKQRGSDFRCRS